MRYYSQLNGLRFIFVMFVLLQHWGPKWIYNKTHIGGLGVNLFFVLSGFLIGEILFIEKKKNIDKRAAIKNFFIRRCLRIFPIYYLTVLLYSCTVNSGGILIWNLTYTNNILECINVNLIPIEFSHLWSLCVEEQFYLIFPFIILGLPIKKIKRLIYVLIFASILFRFIVTICKIGDYNTISSRFTLMCTDCLFLGVLLAYWKQFHYNKLLVFFSQQKLIYISITFCTLFIILLKTYHDEILYNILFRFFSGILGFLIVGYAVLINFKGVFGCILENKNVSEIGKISYGVYLFHPFIQEIYYSNLKNNAIRSFFIDMRISIISNAYIIDFFMLFTLTITVSFLSFNLIEKRFLKLKKNFQ